MNGVAWNALAIVVVLSALAHIAVWSRRDTWGRFAAIVVLLVGIPTVGYAMAETLGRHRPVELWGTPTGTLHVIAAVMRQDEAIWLYVIAPGRSEPLPLSLPWSNETAQKIQEALDGAPEGREGQFLLSFNDTEGGEINAHALPQPAQPPVKDEPDAGLVYEQ